MLHGLAQGCVRRRHLSGWKLTMAGKFTPWNRQTLPTRASLLLSESRLVAPHLQRITPLKYVALSTPWLVFSSWGPKAAGQMEHHLETVWCLKGRKAGVSSSFLSLDAGLSEVCCKGPCPVLGKHPSLVAQRVTNPPAMQETRVRSLGWDDPLEKGKATHSSVLAWRIPWTG